MSTREEINSGWKDCWVAEKHQWHLPVVHPYLKLYFNELTEENVQGKRILIPLCGASYDLFWLFQQGLQVVGVELSEVAIKKFFSKFNLPYTVADYSPTSKVYIHNEHLKIIQCDFFEVNAEMLGGTFDYWWDRGGLVAMVPEEQQKYVDHNKLLLSANGRCLMECFEYDRDIHSGSPNAFYPNEVEALFGNSFEMSQLGRVAKEDLPEEYSISGNIGFSYKLVYYLLKSV